MMKNKYFNLLVLLSLILSVMLLSGSRVTASSPELSVEIDQSSTPVNPESQEAPNTDFIYLPCVLNDYCPTAAPSPFAIQIAGLSEFSALDGLSTSEIDKLRAEQYAELDAAFPTLVDALRDSGAGWARIYIDWALIQPTGPNDYIWTLYDSWLSQVASAGVKMVATVSNPPGWARVVTNPCSNRINQNNLPDFYSFLTTVVNRYKAAPYDIHSWEILNEPDAIDGYRCSTGASNYGQHGAEYATLLQGASSAIKTVDPSASVIQGGIAYDSFYLPTTDPNGDGSPQGKFNRYFIDDVVTAGINNSADAVNFHYFRDFHLEWERWTIGDQPTCGFYTLRDPNQPKYVSYGLDITAKGSHFLNRLKTCYGVNKPLWISETAHHGIHPNNPAILTRPEDTLENQARYIFTVFARSLALGAKNITWYALKIIPSITTMDYQGLLYDNRDAGLDNQPKPAYHAFKTLVRELDGYSYLSTLAIGDTLDSVEAYKFTHPCEGYKIMAWYNKATGTKPFVIATVNKIRLVYRPFDDGSYHQVIVLDGGPGDLDGLINNSITISLSLEPVIIQPTP